MRVRNLLLGIAAVFVAVVMARAQAGAPNRAAIEKQIVTMENAVNDAFAKNDVKGFRAHVADDAWGIDPTGVMSVADYVKMMGGVKIKSWKIDNSRFAWVNNDTVVHIYRWSGEGTMMGEAFPSPTHASTVWTNRGGRWLAVFHQETAAAPPQKK